MGFIRLKILAIVGGESVNKMLAVKTSCTFGEFKTLCAAKLGIGQSTTAANSSDPSIGNSLSFFWEGCEIDEPDDKPLEEMAKEGDTFVVMEKTLPLLPASECQVMALELPPVDDFFSAGPSGRQANSGNSVPTGKRNVSGDHLALVPFGSMDDRGLPSISSQEKKCTCRNSKCIKLYCMCFAGGNLCDGCMCKDCLNAPGNEAFIMSERSKILARNPQAFSLKVEQTGDDLTGHKTGCRCRKSRCVKKYCECFDGGFRCNPNCRCLECANMPDDPWTKDDPDVEQDPEEVHEPLDLEQTLTALDGLASLASAAQIASGCIDDGEAKPSLSPGMAAAVAPYHSVASFNHGGSPEKTSVEAPHLPEGERRSPSDDQGNGEGARSTQGESSRLDSDSFHDKERLAALAASLNSLPLPEMAEAQLNDSSASSLLQNALHNHLMALIKGQGATGSYLSIPLRQTESVSGHSSQQALPAPPSVQSASPLAPLKTTGAQGRSSSVIEPIINSRNSNAMKDTGK